MERLPGDARGRERRGGFRKLVKSPLVSSELFVVVFEASWSKGVFFKVMEKSRNERGRSYLKTAEQQASFQYANGYYNQLLVH